ncbi:MAG: glycosyltransferase family 2 protein [Patescibacteria group bacterium]
MSKTSLIIISHNYGKYLKEAIDSGLKQTLKPAEIIVINDASTDNTGEIAKQFGDLIRYYEVNYQNAQKVRNFGLKKISSKYVLFLDADDYLREDCIEKMEKEMEKDEKLALVYSDRINFEQRGFKKENFTNLLSRNFDFEKLKRVNYISLTSLIRMDSFKGFDEHIERFQDWEAWINMLKDGIKAKRIPEPLFYVRFHGTNKTKTISGTKERLKILVKHNFSDVLEEDIILKKEKLDQMTKEKEKLKKEIQLMKNSKFWKAREFYMKIKKSLTKNK